MEVVWFWSESYENKYKHKIKWPKNSRKCIFIISKKILELNNYKSVWIIIYMIFVVQTAKNSNSLEVFRDMILLSDIMYIQKITKKFICACALRFYCIPNYRHVEANPVWPKNMPLIKKSTIFSQSFRNSVKTRYSLVTDFDRVL